MCLRVLGLFFFFFSSRRRHTRLQGDWSSDVCSSDLAYEFVLDAAAEGLRYVEVRYSPLLHRPALTLAQAIEAPLAGIKDRKSTRLNSSHLVISYAVFCLKKKKTNKSDSQLAA